MSALTTKWTNLIQQETGYTVDVELVGEDKILVVAPRGTVLQEVVMFFVVMGKSFEIDERGALVAL